MFDGVYTAVITPFCENGRVDYASLQKILQYQNSSNISGVVVLGSTAEEKSLSIFEKLKIIELATKIIDKKKVVVGISSANIDETLLLMKKYEKFSFDAYLLGTPYYVKPTQEGLYEYFSICAKHTNMKIILYNVPSRTAASILPNTVQKLSKIENIVGLKDATGNIAYTKDVLSLVDSEFSVLCGNDDMILEMQKVGAVGCVSVVSNIFPNYPVAVYDLIKKGRQNDAVNLVQKYENFINSLFIESNPICIKYAMSKAGFCKNIMRLPLTPAKSQTMKMLNKEIEKILFR